MVRGKAGSKCHSCRFSFCKANSRAGLPPAHGLIIPQQCKLSINSCSRAGGVEIPQNTSTYRVYGNVTSQLGPSKGTDSDGMNGVNRRTQGLKNLQNNPKGDSFPLPAPAGKLTRSPAAPAGRAAGIPRAPAHRSSLLSLVGLAFWCPRFSTFPRDVHSRQHCQPCCPQRRQAAHPSTCPPK